MKDAPNYVLTNMIGLAHTSHEILEDGDVLIFPVVLIILKALRYITITLQDYIIHLLHGGYYTTFMTVRLMPACNTHPHA